MYWLIKVVQNSTFSKKNHSSNPLLNVFRDIWCDPDQSELWSQTDHWTYFLQRNWLKNRKENLVSWFFAFYAFKLIKMTNFAFLDQFVCSLPFFWYPYCYMLWHFVLYDICHKMAFYGILLHISYDIKCQNTDRQTDIVTKRATNAAKNTRLPKIMLMHNA